MAVVSCSSSTTKNEATPGNAGGAEEQRASSTEAFAADSAMAFIKKQVDFGPRVPGTGPHDECADWLAATLRSFGGRVTDDAVTVSHPVTGKPIAVRNIFAQFNPEAQDRILLLAHYDTRPWADEDPAESNRSVPIDGANDGASGVAVVLEVARHAASLDPSRGLDILFVDQEDSGASGDDESWCIGSAYWAKNLPYRDVAPKFAVLLDMVGGRDAVFPWEYFSRMYAPTVCEAVWEAARKAGQSSRFPERVGGAINDDHLPLLRAGIPAIDIIETTQSGFNPTWHTLNDNFENIDPATVKAVGDVMMQLIYSEK